MDMADGHMAHALPTRQYALHSIDTSRAPTWHQHDPTSSCTTFRGRAGSLVAVSLEPGVSLICSGLFACSGDASRTAQARTAHRTSAGSIELPSVAYRPVALASIGT